MKMTTNEKALKLHEEWNGKLETVSKTPVKTREDKFSFHSIMNLIK